MKVFWAIIGVLLLGAVSALVLSDRGVSSPKALPTGGKAATTITPNEPLPEPATRGSTDAKAEAKTEANPESTQEPKLETRPATKADVPSDTKPESAPTTKPDAASTYVAPAQPQPETKPAEARPEDAKPADPNSLQSKPGNTPTDNGGDLLAAPAPAALASVKVEKKDDGSMLIDGRFTVKGAGTAENPYVLPWELLTSAEEVYKPQQGRKELPGRITMFDGKFVRIAGYVAYPMFVEQPRELLSMLNQWDGCCIGIPPTPYDAIEVKLADVVKGNDRLATYGTVEGKLGVKPYLAGDWLVGLYIMEDAKLSVKEYKVGS